MSCCGADTKGTKIGLQSIHAKERKEEKSIAFASVKEAFLQPSDISSGNSAGHQAYLRSPAIVLVLQN